MQPRTPRTIRITEPCEFGEPGDRIRPEPYDVAALLVETRGVAVYDEGPRGLEQLPRAPTDKVAKATRRGAGRKAPLSP